MSVQETPIGALELFSAHEAIEKKNYIKALHFYRLYSENANISLLPATEEDHIVKLMLDIRSGFLERPPDEQEIILQNLAMIIEKFHKNPALSNSLGLFFYAFDQFFIAKQYFELAAKSYHLTAEKNLLHLIWEFIPRWHFRMLNDLKRNEAYRNAINAAISSGCSNVYDIGAGCGLLSLISAKAQNNVGVVAFEELEIFTQLASNIFKINNVDKQITMINKHSTNLKDQPGPCDLIVTEIFDAGVFGEECLNTVTHAIQTFVKNKNYKIIPCSVKVFVTGIQSEEINKNYRYASDTLNILNIRKICIKDGDFEGYDSEFLKTRNVKYLTDTASFLTINFYNCDQLKGLLTGEIELEEFKLTCIDKGTIHAFAVWFELQLDENNKICTDPANTDNKCWEQGIFHLENCIEVESGKPIKIKPSLIGGNLRFSPILHPKPLEIWLKVSKEIITFLNDTKLINKIVDEAKKYDNVRPLKVIDFTIFPMFGFLMAKKGHKVYAIYKNQRDLTLFYKILEANPDITDGRMYFFDYNQIDEMAEYLEKPDLFFVDYIKTDGSWFKKTFSDEIERKLKCGTVPKKIFLCAQLISSQYLDFCNKVKDENVLGFKIENQMNHFSGNEHPCLDNFEYELHSSIVEFYLNNENDEIDLCTEASVTKNGTCNAILYWYNLQFGDDHDKFSTLESTHYQKCCTLLKQTMYVNLGDSIPFCLKRFEGYLKVFIR